MITLIIEILVARLQRGFNFLCSHFLPKNHIVSVKTQNRDGSTNWESSSNALLQRM